MLLNKNVSLRPAGAADWPAIEALLRANKLPAGGRAAAPRHLPAGRLQRRSRRLCRRRGLRRHRAAALGRRRARPAPQGHRPAAGRAPAARSAPPGHPPVFLLTVTAPEYFARYGFKRGRSTQAPEALKASAEFQGACPACAAFMSLTLQRRTAAAHRPAGRRDRCRPGRPGRSRPPDRARHRPLLVLEAGEQRRREPARLRPRAPVLALALRHRPGDGRAARRAPAGSAPPADELPLAGEVVERVLQPYRRAAGRGRARCSSNTRVLSISREGFDKVKSAGRESAPFVIRAVQDGQTGRAARPRRDRCHRHLVTRRTRWARTACRRSASARTRRADLLRHPRRARRTTAARYRGQAHPGRRCRALAPPTRCWRWPNWPRQVPGTRLAVGGALASADARLRRRRCRRAAGARRSSARRCADAARQRRAGVHRRPAHHAQSAARRRRS